MVWYSKAFLPLRNRNVHSETLKTWKRFKVTVVSQTRRETLSPGSNVKKDEKSIRNVAVMAHIDAGKTTTTERMLYNSGLLSIPGEVDRGDTVTDFMVQERDRGITIQSAVVTFKWKGSQINLIDTPGHIDFMFEVQRCLRVVDSVVAILDATAGVEAQTLSVWRQANEYRLPRLIYLNKMDRDTASVEKCLDSIRRKLNCKPILLQCEAIDIDKSICKSGLVGVVDLVNFEKTLFLNRKEGPTKCAFVDSRELEACKIKREELIENLADVDEIFAESVIQNEEVDNVSSKEIEAALIRATHSGTIVPVFIGSSYKDIGVHTLMDALVTYRNFSPSFVEYITIPSPNQRPRNPEVDALELAFNQSSELCSYAFKSMHDSQTGLLTFLRVFGGNINAGSKVYNLNRHTHEKLNKLYIPFAEELIETKEAKSGDVVIASGLNSTYTGDTIVESYSAAKKILNKVRSKGHEVSSANLSGVNIPDPVFFCSIEPESASQQKDLDKALSQLQKEDPSFQVNYDADSGQTVMSGMGELHLEIMQARLATEYKLQTYLGKIQVAYKECIMGSVSESITLERKFGDSKHIVTLELEFASLVEAKHPDATWVLKPAKGKDVQESLAHIHPSVFKTVENGISSALRTGPKLHLPVIYIQPYIRRFQCKRGTSDAVIEAAAASCTANALKQAVAHLLEPIASLEVTCPSEYHYSVHDDLNRRRFIIENIQDCYGEWTVSGKAPVSMFMGYSTALRKATSGLGTFSLEFSHYDIVASDMEDVVRKEITGF